MTIIHHYGAGCGRFQPGTPLRRLQVRERNITAAGRRTDMPGDDGSAPGWRGPDVARRRMLVVAGGAVVTGIASLVGCDGGSQPTAAPGGARRATATTTAAGPAATRKLVRAPASGVPQHGPGHPAGHPRATRKTVLTRETASGQPVYYLDDGPKVVALTIDDGPSPVYTPQVLRILEKYGVRATFSMVG